jgi:hypothetical protein
MVVADPDLAQPQMSLSQKSRPMAQMNNVCCRVSRSSVLKRLFK